MEINSGVEYKIGLLVRLILEALGHKPSEVKYLNKEDIQLECTYKLDEANSLSELFYLNSLISTEFPLDYLDSKLLKSNDFLYAINNEVDSSRYNLPLEEKLKVISKRIENQKDFFEITNPDYKGYKGEPKTLIKIIGNFTNNKIIIRDVTNDKQFFAIPSNTEEHYWYFLDYAENSIDYSFPLILINENEEQPGEITYKLKDSTLEDYTFKVDDGFLLDGYSNNKFRFQKYQNGNHFNLGVFNTYNGQELFRFSLGITTNPFIDSFDSNNPLSINRCFQPVLLLGTTSDETNLQDAICLAMIAMMSITHKEVQKWATDIYKSMLYSKNNFPLYSTLHEFQSYIIQKDFMDFKEKKEMKEIKPEEIDEGELNALDDENEETLTEFDKCFLNAKRKEEQKKK